MYPMTTSLMFELTAYLLVGVFLALYYIHKNKTYFFDQFHLRAYWLILIGNISNLFGLAIFFIYPSARESFAILIMASGILWFLATLFGIRLEKIAFRLMIALFFYLLFCTFFMQAGGVTDENGLLPHPAVVTLSRQSGSMRNYVQ